MVGSNARAGPEKLGSYQSAKIIRPKPHAELNHIKRELPSSGPKVIANHVPGPRKTLAS